MPHKETSDKLKQLWSDYKKRLAESRKGLTPNEGQSDFQKLSLQQKRQRISDPALGIDSTLYQTPLNVSQQMDLEGIVWPELRQFASGQIDSAVAGDTVLVTGIANKVLLVLATTSYKVAGTTQAWRYEMDTGAAFATTRRISETNTTDKEMQGQLYHLEPTERIVINVTTAIAATTIDWTVSYVEIGFGTVWAQS